MKSARCTGSSNPKVPMHTTNTSVTVEFLLHCMLASDEQPGTLEERVLHEVIANLLAGKRDFSAEADDYIYRFHESLENELYSYAGYAFELHRLHPWWQAMQLHGRWAGVGAGIDFDSMQEPPYSYGW
ncbi:MAG: hypothetical protein Greene041619_1174 [Candidatus Peregrinibacteria bacterium Greene0416_19]|nr:MAG: hypothetical protein Greene041619_1174 [Candidatus Peregrinibacteria bacterium Greene0416_19]